MPDADETGSGTCPRCGKFRTQLALLGKLALLARAEKLPKNSCRYDRNSSPCVTVLRKR